MARGWLRTSSFERRHPLRAVSDSSRVRRLATGLWRRTAARIVAHGAEKFRVMIGPRILAWRRLEQDQLMYVRLLRVNHGQRSCKTGFVAMHCFRAPRTDPGLGRRFLGTCSSCHPNRDHLPSKYHTSFLNKSGSSSHLCFFFFWKASLPPPASVRLPTPLLSRLSRPSAVGSQSLARYLGT